MILSAKHLTALRATIASWPADASSDAHGVRAPTLEELYAPASHAAALDPASTIVRGARGTGKSFWAGVLERPELRNRVARAYPRLGLDKIDVQFGFTGLGGPNGIDREKLDACVPKENATEEQARRFWWATVLRAIDVSAGRPAQQLAQILPRASDISEREALLTAHATDLKARGQTLLVVYDALDTVAIEWSRRRLLTQALLEVVWSMRAFGGVRLKLFLRPDQLDDEALQFVELPKLRTGAVRLAWNCTELYALFFKRLVLGDASAEFETVLGMCGVSNPTPDQILSRDWSGVNDENSQRSLMAVLAGRFMAAGQYGHKKGNTYDWPYKHLGDTSGEVTPRSFLALLTGAALKGPAPAETVISPDGIRHGLRLASKMRVDQLHLEFKWIKGVLAPLAGLLLPATEKQVLGAWKRAGTVRKALDEADRFEYLPPFPKQENASEQDLVVALEKIFVMSRRGDDRLDMPDLFRVAAKLLKKGAPAPL